MIAHLSSPWSLVYAAAYLAAVALLLWANHAAHRRPTVVRAVYPPPVPAPLPRPESDADWVSVWPSGAHLIDVDAVHGLLSEDDVYPTADEAERRVYNKLFDNLIEMSWPRERQGGDQ